MSERRAEAPRPTAAPRGPIREGSRIAGRYRLDTKLGGHGVATTWQASSETAASSGVVVVKTFDPKVLDRKPLVEALERTFAQVERLPGDAVVPLLDASLDRRTEAPYVASAMSPHPSLAELVRLCPLSPLEAERFVLSLAQALSVAHGAGVLHLGLKPTNVFVGPGPNYQVRVGDFGSALVHAAFPVGDAPVHAAAWQSPEQTRGEEGAIASDVYSAALVLFFALTGRPYYRATREGQATLDALRSEQLAPGGSVCARAAEFRLVLPPTLDAPFARALSPRAADRFASIAELGEALSQALAGRTSVPRTRTAPSSQSMPAAEGANAPVAPRTTARPTPSGASRVSTIPVPPGAEALPPPAPLWLRTSASSPPATPPAIVPAGSPSPPASAAPATEATPPTMGMADAPEGAIRTVGGGLSTGLDPALDATVVAAPEAVRAVPSFRPPPSSPPVVEALPLLPGPSAASTARRRRTALVVGGAAGAMVLALAAAAAIHLARPNSVADVTQEGASPTPSAANALAATSATPADEPSAAPTREPHTEPDALRAPPPIAASDGTAAHADGKVDPKVDPKADAKDVRRPAVATRDAPAPGPREAVLVFTCKPKCDRIVIDGKHVVSPDEPAVVRAGSHTVVAFKDKHVPQSKPVRVAAGERKTIPFYPTPLTATKPCGKFLKRCD